MDSQMFSGSEQAFPKSYLADALNDGSLDEEMLEQFAEAIGRCDPEEAQTLMSEYPYFLHD